MSNIYKEVFLAVFSAMVAKEEDMTWSVIRANNAALLVTENKEIMAKIEAAEKPEIHGEPLTTSDLIVIQNWAMTVQSETSSWGALEGDQEVFDKILEMLK